MSWRPRDLVLIVTRSDDHAGVEAVMRAIRRAGGRSARLDSDLFPTAVRTTSRLGAAAPRRRLRVADDAGDLLEVDDAEIGAVWYRRYAAGQALPPMGDLRGPAVDESRRSLYGTLAALADDDGVPIPHLDRLEDVRRCDHKELQLQWARELGLQIPETLFTNDVDAARAFLAEQRSLGREVITKMQSSFALYRRGEEHVVFTSVVGPDDDADLEGLRYCPMQFQARVEKQLELRATVVGDEVFCAAVDSQGRAETAVDWRKDGVGLLHAWTRYALDTSTSTALVALVRRFGLTYAAADFIVTPEGQLVFLEINAGGEWFWLDEHYSPIPGLPIARALAGTLVRAARTGRCR